MTPVGIIIPTWNNYELLRATLFSVLGNTQANHQFHIYVVNNGHKNSCDWIQDKRVTVLQSGGNLGWEGGLKLGLKHSKEPFTMFLNDDIHIPLSSFTWVGQMLQHFKNPKVGAVGPSSNVVMGFQNIFSQTERSVFKSTFLIGFCMLVRRKALEEAGGIDDTCPGGDDLDLSIRLRDKGYTLLVDKNVFVYHHGFKTGNRLHGDASKKDGWNSFEKQEKTNHWLIRKHGFRKWHECMQGAYKLDTNLEKEVQDAEGDIIRKKVKGEKIIDLGCGGNKTLKKAIGVDMVKKGIEIDSLGGVTSDADIEADVSQGLPIKDVDTIIARHILEHMIDPVMTLKNWKTALKKGGRLILALPDEELYRTIPVNIEHVHAYTKESLKSLLDLVGFTVEEQLSGGNNISFITICKN